MLAKFGAMLLMATASASASDAPMTLQQAFDAASADATAGRCEQAVAAFDVLQRRIAGLSCGGNSETIRFLMRQRR